MGSQIYPTSVQVNRLRPALISTIWNKSPIGRSGRTTGRKRRSV
ncbi:hypothetical protein Btus_2205 [Kyrpidia tusciae DSM 2912]|uniref:Uncharacterized protein n=1 Tax=Kyrpidia tusciae (strain DSM 2912 / NBRC 15312 / T2) TaxID=562970 RepID=D5WRT0_KYRT2|nr:hypothetical protein Btus_2205 [Kyrpidia tusciae DSM 2912]